MRKLKWVTSFVLMISAALALPVASFASGASPEFEFLEGMLALNAQKISAEQANQKMDALAKTYLADSAQTPEDRQERMVEAMVDLNIATPAQAEQLANATSTANFSDVSDAALSSEIYRIASTSMSGAQFSAGCVIVPLFITGIAASFGYGSYAISQENLPGVSDTTRYAVTGTVAALAAVSLAFAVKEITYCQ